MKRYFLFPAVLLFFAVPVVAQQNQPLPVDPAVITGKLPNGLTYYIRKNTEPAKRAMLYLVTNVGSLQEAGNQLGLAHFTEHMAFNGSRDFPKNELINYLQKAGVKFGADVNASTSFNETIYKLPLPTDSMEVFAKSFSILANWAGYVSFEEDAINRERGIILEEERSRGKNVAERTQKKIFPDLLNHSRYAERMPIGTDEILKNFKPAVIKDFYHDWYRPNLQAVIAVGDFDPKQAEALIRKNFSGLKNPLNPKKRTVYSIPPTTGTVVRIVTDQEQTSTRLQVVVRQQGKAVQTTGDLLNSISRSLFNRMMGSRVAELRQQANTPILIASIGYGNFLADVDAFTVALTAKPGRLEEATKKVLAVKAQVKQFGFLETELQRAKLSLLNTLEKQWKERNKNNSSNYVNEYVSHFTKREAIPGIDYEYHFAKDHLAQIELKTINQLIRRFDVERNRVIVVEAPEKDKALLPDEKTLLSWIDGAAKDAVPYVDNVVTEPLLALKPLGTKIAAEKTNPGTGVTELLLGNGVKVILKPTTFKNDQVIINGYSYGGTSLVADSSYTSASLAALLVNRSGLGRLSRAQLNKMLSGRSVNISASISEFTEGISGSSSPAELETAMQLIYLYFTQPGKDAVAWSSTVSQQQSTLANRGASPVQVFQDTVMAVLNSHHPRKMPGSLTALKGASMDAAYRFYKDRFADASDFTFILVGNLDTAKVKQLAAQYLGALPSIHRTESFKDLGERAPEGQLKKIVYKGLEAKSRVQLVFSGDYHYSEKENIQLEALKEVINYRLLDRLRAKESGVYTPSVSVAYTNIPTEKYSLTITFNCAPENVDKLIEASLEEVASVRNNGPDGAELQKFIAGQKRTRETQLNSNTYWAYYLRGEYMMKEKPEEILKQNADLDGITQKSIQQAAVQYVSGRDLIEFILMPEKKEAF